MNKKQSLLHLSLIPQVGPAKVEALVAQFGVQLPNLYSFTYKEFRSLGATEKTAQLLVEGLKDTTYLDQELKLIEKHGIQWCTIFDDEYPQLLKEIHLAPPVLYYQGNLNFPEKTIAFVGSRAKSVYGAKVVQNLVPGLVNEGWGIVSGGAYGIDTIAHQATIDAGGKTFVVLGSGLLRPYPSDNKKLFEAVVHQGGAVMSSFPLTMEPHPHNFPARNRIIAGLSHGTLVVRAAKKSGALITAKYALQEGLSVFAVPGQIDDKLSAGCHALLAQGAQLVTGPESFFEEFGLSAQSQIPLKTAEPVDPLVAFCAPAKTVDELIELSKLPEIELKNQLFELQLAGKLQQNFAGLWEQV